MTSLNVEEDGALICTVYDPLRDTWDSQHLYSIRMMKLRGNEFNLNGGRFRGFRFAPQQYRILLARDEAPLTWFVPAWSTAIVEWIAGNIDTTWSMKGVSIEHHGLDLEFSFANAVAAVHFALRWR